MEPTPISSQELPAGTRLEEFVIERVLGEGGFGITYLARDTGLGRLVVIKENLPVQFAWRDPQSLTVAPRHTSGDASDFAWSLENFSKEAAMLASLDHPGIVKVLRSFSALGTAYFVMPFVEGVALDALVGSRKAQGQPFSEEELRGLLNRTLDALAHLHDRGIYHRDIKPGNILITNAGIPVLIDFGSARQRLSERSMTVVESAGYTPFEQLQSRGNVGPWSDLYALGGTLCKVITGEAPPKAMDRMRNDPFVPLAKRQELLGDFTADFLWCLDRSLCVDEPERWQDAGKWVAALKTVLNPVKAAPVMPEIEHSSESAKANTTHLPESRSDGEFVANTLATVGEILTGVPFAVRIAAILVGSLFLAGIFLTTPLAQMTNSRPVVTQAEPAKKYAVAAPQTFEGSRAGEKRDFEIAPGVNITMCWIPPGEFIMGSPSGEMGRNDDEAQHRVEISNGFWLAKTETTQAQWQAVMGENPSKFQGENFPVEPVSWNDIAGTGGFLSRINERAGDYEGRFQLPSEAQWEYACRAGVSDASGNLRSVAWYYDNSGSKTHAVGQKQANAWGLHDMKGNVWEWCDDWYGTYPSGVSTDPSGPASGLDRVLRGGSWVNFAVSCRVAFRGNASPSDMTDNFGFRVARSSGQ